MKKYYRGWKLMFNGVVYTATKKGCVPLMADNRVGIERLVDVQEFIDWQNEAIAAIKKANNLLRKYKKLFC